MFLTRYFVQSFELFSNIFIQVKMVSLVSTGVCTPTLANVCLGDADVVMELDHLTLAEYRASPNATFPAMFGGRVSSGFDLDVSVASINSSVLARELGFVRRSSPIPDRTESSGYSNISQTCYDMLEK